MISSNRKRELTDSQVVHIQEKDVSMITRANVALRCILFSLKLSAFLIFAVQVHAQTTARSNTSRSLNPSNTCRHEAHAARGFLRSSTALVRGIVTHHFTPLRPRIDSLFSTARGFASRKPCSQHAGSIHHLRGRCNGHALLPSCGLPPTA